MQTLQSLLLFYPSDKDSLDNLQLYSETLGGDTEPQGMQPSQVPVNDHYVVHVSHSYHHLSSSYVLNWEIRAEESQGGHFRPYIPVSLSYLCGFSLQEIIRYINRSLQEKKLLYFGMENLDFGFIDPVSLIICNSCPGSAT